MESVIKNNTATKQVLLMHTKRLRLKARIYSKLIMSIEKNFGKPYSKTILEKLAKSYDLPIADNKKTLPRIGLITLHTIFFNIIIFLSFVIINLKPKM